MALRFLYNDTEYADLELVVKIDSQDKSIYVHSPIMRKVSTFINSRYNFGQVNKIYLNCDELNGSAVEAVVRIIYGVKHDDSEVDYADIFTAADYMGASFVVDRILGTIDEHTNKDNIGRIIKHVRLEDAGHDRFDTIRRLFGNDILNLHTLLDDMPDERILLLLGEQRNYSSPPECITHYEYVVLLVRYYHGDDLVGLLLSADYDRMNDEQIARILHYDDLDKIVGAEYAKQIKFVAVQRFKRSSMVQHVKKHRIDFDYKFDDDRIQATAKNLRRGRV